MRRLLIAFGYFYFGIALVGLGSTLFGTAGIWGFLAFFIGSIAGGFWLLLGFVVGKATKLGEILVPSTPEAKLRRRLFRTSLTSVAVRSEVDSAVDLLRRLEYVWGSIETQLAARLAPCELTYQRYDGAARLRGQIHRNANPINRNAVSEVQCFLRNRGQRKPVSSTYAEYSGTVSRNFRSSILARATCKATATTNRYKPTGVADSMAMPNM